MTDRGTAHAADQQADDASGFFSSSASVVEVCAVFGGLTEAEALRLGAVTADERDQPILPSAYLAVACLDEVTGCELTARRALLLRALGSAGPGDLAGALALTAVIAEQDTRPGRTRHTWIARTGAGAASGAQ
ncbi:MAG TPA: hypothetical protein VF070_32680 [Streptosporangiaceae bacterium]